ncbi:MAG: hypothetical protein GY829_07415 [Gammaproteobacteria bacterium]|nr:hypothetical protein [Gammaproteobacteria bacterium]
MPQLITNNEDGLTHNQTLDIGLYLFHESSCALFAYATNKMEGMLLYELYHQIKVFEFSISEHFERVEMYERYGVGRYNSPKKFAEMISQELDDDFDKVLALNDDDLFEYVNHIKNQLAVVRSRWNL